MTATIIEVSHIAKRFGPREVLSSLSWQVTRGQVIGLLGRNGAGKSTLLECLLGLRETDTGSVTLFGENVTDLSDVARAKIGYVPQKSDLFEWLTPRQMLDYFKALYPHWNDAKVDELLARWGFDAFKCSQAISKLSGGEKQRLSIIRALAHDPELLILDEPVSALDPVGRREFLRELVDNVIERNTTVVFSTHILSDLERVAVDIAFLKDGKIALQGGLDELMEGARRVVGPSSAIDAIKIAGELRRVDGADGRSALIVRSASPELMQAVAAAPAVRVEAMTLEELFVAVTQ
jgi:ABC-2 type transport system ATP-binding protein